MVSAGSPPVEAEAGSGRHPADDHARPTPDAYNTSTSGSTPGAAGIGADGGAGSDAARPPTSGETAVSHGEVEVRLSMEDSNGHNDGSGRETSNGKPAGSSGATPSLSGGGVVEDGEAKGEEKRVRPPWTGSGPDPFASDEEDDDFSMGGLALSKTLSKVVSRAKFEQQRVTSYVIIVCVVAACGGLLFGYSLAITSGVAAMDAFVEKFFPADAVPSEEAAVGTDNSTAPTVTYCPDSDLTGLGFYTSSLFLAGAVASPVTFVASARLGRRGCMLIAGFTYLVGGVLQTAAVHVAMLYIGRICTGVAVAFANQSVPVFLSEMSPPKLRGALAMGFQFAVTLGILVSQVLTYAMNELSEENGWRYALGLATVPALIVLLGAAFLPDTPNSLISRGQVGEGKAVLERIRGTPNVTVEFIDISEAATNMEKKDNWKCILQRDHRPQLVIAIIVPVIQQLTGANAVLFYAPIIFQSSGSSTSAALLSSVIVGCTNVGATIAAVFMVDRFGRKPLLLEGLVQMLVAMLVMATSLALADGGKLTSGLSAVLLAMILLFFTGYAWSWAGLAWIIPNEVQPLDSRSSGQAVAVFCNFLASFAVGQTFPLMLCSMQWGVYLFYSSFIVLAAIFTLMLIPETKGLGIEDIYYLFTGHWFWQRFFTKEQQEAVILAPEAKTSLGVPGGHLSMVLSRQLSRRDVPRMFSSVTMPSRPSAEASGPSSERDP